MADTKYRYKWKQIYIYTTVYCHFLWTTVYVWERKCTINPSSHDGLWHGVKCISWHTWLNLSMLSTAWNYTKHNINEKNNKIKKTDKHEKSLKSRTFVVTIQWILTVTKYFRQLRNIGWFNIKIDEITCRNPISPKVDKVGNSIRRVWDLEVHEACW